MRGKHYVLLQDFRTHLLHCWGGLDLVAVIWAHQHSGILVGVGEAVAIAIRRLAFSDSHTVMRW